MNSRAAMPSAYQRRPRRRGRNPGRQAAPGAVVAAAVAANAAPGPTAPPAPSPAAAANGPIAIDPKSIAVCPNGPPPGVNGNGKSPAAKGSPKPTTAPRRARRRGPEPETPAAPTPQSAAPAAGEVTVLPLEPEVMDLGGFLTQYGPQIAQHISNHMTPRYRPRRDNPLPALRRQPLSIAQSYAIQAAALALEQNPGAMIIGEMGTGKTYISIAAAAQSGQARILVICPSHLVKKWKREVEATLPQVRAVIVKTVKELERSRRWPATPERPVFTILSKEYAKLSYAWRPAVLWTYKKTPAMFHPNTGALIRGPRLRRDEETDEYLKEPRCPACFAVAMDAEEEPYTPQQLEAKQRVCSDPACGQPLWQAGRMKGGKVNRIALAEYIKKRMRRWYDLLIVDEVQDYKAKNSGQGISVGVLAECSRKSLALTGTLMGGYSSTIFHILYRFSKEIRGRYGYHEVRRWIKDYGFEEQLYRSAEDEKIVRSGRTSRRRLVKEQIVEKPGISPTALYHLIGNTVFLRLEDVATGLPSYLEQVVTLPLSRQYQQTAKESQASAYKQLHDALKSAVAKQAVIGSKKLMGKYIQSLLSYPDGCLRSEIVRDAETGGIIASAPALDDAEVYPKEKALLELTAQEQALGRRTLIFISHTDTRDLSPRLKELLTKAGCKTEVLKSGSPSSGEREAWVQKKVDQGLQALIVNPRLVQTGLDLIQFPTIIWYENDYSVYVTRQASRRSWRIGQTQPVKVFFLAYEDTMQLQALKLIARKTQASLALEGELPEEGLAAFDAAEEDLILALARQMLQEDEPGGAEAEGKSLESILRQAKKEQAAENEMLAAEGWHIAPPETAQPPPPFLFAFGRRPTLTPEEAWQLQELSALTPSPKAHQQNSLFDFVLNGPE